MSSSAKMALRLPSRLVSNSRLAAVSATSSPLAISRPTNHTHNRCGSCANMPQTASSTRCYSSQIQPVRPSSTAQPCSHGQLSPSPLRPLALQLAQQQTRGMKVRSSVKKLCEGCKVCVTDQGITTNLKVLTRNRALEGKVTYTSFATGIPSISKGMIVKLHKWDVSLSRQDANEQVMCRQG